jgi:hypothetical protein
VASTVGMTWANDETGMLVITDVGKAKAGKKKPPKPAKVKPEKAAKPTASARDARPAAPPIGLPIARQADVRAGARTAVNPSHGRTTTRPPQRSNRVLRGLGSLFIASVIATGGFAAGALTEVGTQAEELLLGPPAAPTPAIDPRLPGLQAELERVQGELAIEQRTVTELRAAAAAAEAAAPAELVIDPAADEPKRESRRSRRDRRRR